jgi:hypothetical protein
MAITRQNDSKDYQLMLMLRKAAGLSQQAFGVMIGVPVTLDAAVTTLRMVSKERSSISKFVTFRNVITFISEEAKRCSPPGYILTTDDLLPLLSATIAQSGCSDLASHLDFMERFGWTPKTQAEFPYVTTTMQAALAHLISVVGPVSPGPTDSRSPRTSNAGSFSSARPRSAMEPDSFVSVCRGEPAPHDSAAMPAPSLRPLSHDLSAAAVPGSPNPPGRPLSMGSGREINLAPLARPSQAASDQQDFLARLTKFAL